MSYHAQQPVTRKYGGIVTTVDPSQSIIQVALKTGDNISIGSYTTNTVWRWPQVGDQVMVRQENGSWILEGWFLNAAAAETIQDADPGDAVIMAPTGVIRVIGSSDGSTDFNLTGSVSRCFATWPDQTVTAGNTSVPAFSILAAPHSSSDWTAVGGALIVPNTGLYDISFNTRGDGTAICYGQLTLEVNGGFTLIRALQDNSYYGGVVYPYRNYSATQLTVPLNEGDAIKPNFQCNGAGQITFFGNTSWPGAGVSIKWVSNA